MKSKFYFLRLSALCEGTSLILLVFIAVPLKYFADMPMWVTLIGPIHGVLFLTFVTLLFLNLSKRTISTSTFILGCIAAFIPCGTFVFKALKLKDNDSIQD